MDSGCTPSKPSNATQNGVPTTTPGPKPKCPKFRAEHSGSILLPDDESGLLKKEKEKRKPRDPWVIPIKYYIPRKVCQRSLETVDGHDSPDRPGLIKESSLRAMGERFYGTFGARHKDDFEKLIDHLRRHTRRRRGESVLQEGFLEWENTSRVYEMFKVDLNVFERIFFTVDVGESGSVLSKFFSGFLIGSIIVSIVNWMVSTLPTMTEIPACPPTTDVSATITWCCVEPGDCAPEAKGFFKAVEVVTVLIFTAEYLVRLFTVHSVRFELLNEFFLSCCLCGEADPDLAAKFDFAKKDPQLDGRAMTTLKHVTASSNLVDLLSILPFWVERLADDGSGASVLVILRILRLTRIFRVFKLGKYNDVFTMFSAVIQQSLPALGLMLFFIGMGLCLFGTLMWFAEQGTWYPEGHPTLDDMGITNRGAYLRNISSVDPLALDETPFPSIIHAFWFVIVTITTVGYGDSFPTTSAGKFVGTISILCGIVVLAMPVGVVGANFSNQYEQREGEKKRRLKLKKQQEQTARVEMEQDAAADMELSGVESQPTDTKETQGAELRQKIIIDAQEIDNSWKDCFPDYVYEWLSKCLRRFVAEFIDGAMNTGKTISKGGRVTNLPHRLDQLTLRFNEACSSVVSYDELAEFGLKDAREKRRRVAMFADKIWEYWATIGPPERPGDPFEYFELKAQLIQNMDEFTQKDDSHAKTEEHTEVVKLPPGMIQKPAKLSSVMKHKTPPRLLQETDLTTPGSVPVSLPEVPRA